MDKQILTRLMELCDDSIELSLNAQKSMGDPTEEDLEDIDKDIELVKSIKLELIKEATYFRVLEAMTTYFEEAVQAEDDPYSSDLDARFKDFFTYMYHSTNPLKDD